MRHPTPFLIALCVAAFAPPAAAQTCLGTASFGAGHVQLGARTALATAWGSGELRLSAGTCGVFGGLSVAIDYFTGGIPYPEGYALEGSGWVGYEVRPWGRLGVCPIASYRGQFGPRDLSSGITTVRNRYSAGLAAGRLLPLGRSSGLVPTVSVSVVHDADSFEQDLNVVHTDLTFLRGRSVSGWCSGGAGRSSRRSRSRSRAGTGCSPPGARACW
jgi:hypothetical protein